MNLKEALKNMTDEELGELLNEIVNRQLEKAKEEEEEPLHHYSFSGEWYFDCWARSKDEAERYLSEATIEDFDLNFERVEMEVDDC
jgi:hypothetical protein